MGRLSGSGAYSDELRTVHLRWRGVAAALPALASLDQQIEQQSTRARARFAEICRRKGIPLLEGAQRSTSVTASWHALRDGLVSLAHQARHTDLIVMGRPGRSNGLTRAHLETVLSASGRPLTLTGTRVIGCAPASVLNQSRCSWTTSHSSR